MLRILCLLLWKVSRATGQGSCGVNANQCPPVLSNGVEVPSLCVGDEVPPRVYRDTVHVVCHPDALASSSGLSLEGLLSLNVESGEPRARAQVVVVSNVYVGCDGGRREAAVFAHVAQRYYDAGAPVVFVNSLKGGGGCGYWPNLYQQGAESMYPDEPDVVPREAPVSVDDVSYALRDALFTTPFGHPSYVVLEASSDSSDSSAASSAAPWTVRAKFVGPCCGLSYYACRNDQARTLDDALVAAVDEVLSNMDTDDSSNVPTLSPSTDSSNFPSVTPSAESNDDSDMEDSSNVPTMTPSAESNDDSDTDDSSNVPTLTPSTENNDDSDCIDDAEEGWSVCSIVCGVQLGVSFRVGCDGSVQTRPCRAARNTCSDDPTTKCSAVAVVETVATGFDDPRDVAFHPIPGQHLGGRSEGRTFFPDDDGEEAWVVNGGNHTISIVASLGVDGHQTTLSRTDRGYYHYTVRATALDFNAVSNSGRDPEKDSLGYWAVCNDASNDYVGTKEPNFFMGPTLYDSRPYSIHGRNVVDRLGGPCETAEECFFLHADMLHEAPRCVGIVHDPEHATAYGNVYWAYDTTGDRTSGQLVRFDFQQPHGPGSMDHSVAAVRRYPQIQLGPSSSLTSSSLTSSSSTDRQHHAGMVVHPTRRELFVAVPSEHRVVVVGADTGSYARTAREEYPIFSNRLPSFEYSIWECAHQGTFSGGDVNVDVDVDVDVDTDTDTDTDTLVDPSGMALSRDGNYLFVAERSQGRIHIYEVSSSMLIDIVDVGTEGGEGFINGMATSPLTGDLYFVESGTDSLRAVRWNSCLDDTYESRWNPEYGTALEEAGLTRPEIVPTDCAVDPVVPDVAFFDQVHPDTGYASSDETMEADAAALADRTDCGYDSALNFDQLLLGGYLCHTCLPEVDRLCDGAGEGVCTNVQWRGYTCDNEFRVVHVHTTNTKNNDDNEENGATTLQLHTPEGVPVAPETLLLRPSTLYRFTVVTVTGNEKWEDVDVDADAVTVTARTGPEADSSLWKIEGNDCSCATDGPLLLRTSSNDSSVYLHSSLSPDHILELAVGVSFESEDVEEIPTTPVLSNVWSGTVVSLFLAMLSLC